MKKVLFLIQGEGRGHLSQAIAMQEVIRDSFPEYEIIPHIGKVSHREIPQFAVDAFPGLATYKSFEFKYNKAGELSLFKTVFHSIKNLPIVLRELKRIN